MPAHTSLAHHAVAHSPSALVSIVIIFRSAARMMALLHHFASLLHHLLLIWLLCLGLLREHRRKAERGTGGKHNEKLTHGYFSVIS